MPGVPEDLLDRVLSEIRERLERSRAAYEESQVLERALAALGPGASARADRTDARAASTRRPGPRRRRAAAGANREAILAVVRERPGVSVGEVQAATGIARSSVSVVLTRLVGEGALRRDQLPGGGVGFSEARPGRAADSVGDGTSVEPASETAKPTGDASG
jgi:DNA-binding transcriptional ArsR family regulator